MLSCLVVLAGGDLPGSGFYKLGRELGLVESGEDDMAFAVRQMKATFAYWRSRGGDEQVRAVARSLAGPRTRPTFDSQAWTTRQHSTGDTGGGDCPEPRLA